MGLGAIVPRVASMHASYALDGECIRRQLPMATGIAIFNTPPGMPACSKLWQQHAIACTRLTCTGTRVRALLLQYRYGYACMDFDGEWIVLVLQKNLQ